MRNIISDLFSGIALSVEPAYRIGDWIETAEVHSDRERGRPEGPARRRGDELDRWARTINPQFVRVLRTIGFDRTWARAEGAYLFDTDGNRYLDMLGGFGMYNVGRNNPRIRAALVEALELDTPGIARDRRHRSCPACSPRS